MAGKKLAIGIQSFIPFYEGGLIYVDKTEKIYEMMEIWGYHFIVRPRRFGKSLFLNVLASIYEGRKERFEETWIYDKVDWEKIKHPVLRIDFTQIEYNACSLEEGLVAYLRPIVQKLGLHIEEVTARNFFKRIIEYLGERTPIVILIDEYEMAVTDFVGIEEEQQKMEENIRTLKKFYGVMKGAGDYIHKAYITGVTKIGQVSILSDLNMLNDLTLDKRFTTLFGYTEKELRKYYGEFIEAAAAEHKVSTEEILARIKQHYNGYSWDGIEENKVYNPFSIVNFFQSLSFRNYWFNTGTPTVLVRGARKEQITMEDLEHFEASGNLLQNANLKQFYSLSLLFQAGYLTIKEVIDDNSFLLGFPNQEVRDAFASYLLAEYVDKDWAYMEYTISHKLKMCLEREQLKEAFQIFAPVISSTGYDITKHTEGYFHTIMHVLMYSTGLAVFSELQNAQGRLDTVCVAKKAVYLFEFKINSTASAALAQIKNQHYTAQFFVQNKAYYIIGVNFVTADKKINDILVEKWENDAFVKVEGDFVPSMN
ncbi:MAG: AAA family ATPase [Bacteroidia bacterium]